MNALHAIDASVEDMREAHCTGTVENLLEARAALAELVQAAQAFCGAMPAAYADNAAVVGNWNALQIENMRNALARVKGVAV